RSRSRCASRAARRSCRRGDRRARRACARRRRTTARRVERDEPNAAAGADADIRAEVQLWNRTEAARRKEAAGPGVSHPECHDADPRTVLANVGLDSGRQERAELIRIDRPVGEEEVVPALREKGVNQLIKAYD